MDYIRHFNSALGGITLASDGAALVGLWFDGQKHFGSTLSKEHEEKKLPIFNEACRWLDDYFNGKEPAFTPEMVLRGTEFQIKVWKTLLSIPYGKTITYGEIAASIAASTGCKTMSAQAVGNAVGRNPISIIIPCHRVLGAGGRLTGYAGGLDRKRQLLELENRF